MTLDEYFDSVLDDVSGLAGHSESYMDGELVISKRSVEFLVRDIQLEMRRRLANNNFDKPIKKFLFIEDGSVDTDELIAELENRNPEIKVVVYRQGSHIPVLEEPIY